MFFGPAVLEKYNFGRVSRRNLKFQGQFAIIWGPKSEIADQHFQNLEKIRDILENK